MEVAFHVGVHGTDEDRILQALRSALPALTAAGVEISPPGVNEPILAEALNALKGGTASASMEEVVRDALVERDDARRVIISRPTLLGGPRRLIEGGGLLTAAPTQMRALANVLPRAGIEFFMALKNPATLAPDVLARMVRRDEGLASSLRPAELRWAPAVRRILDAIGERRLVLWCNEDLPLLLPEVARRMARLPAETPLPAQSIMAEALLTDAGKALLAQRLEGLAPGDTRARRATTAEVLAAHARPEALALTIEGVDWDQSTVDAMTAAYDTDVAEIAALPGVEFIAP